MLESPQAPKSKRKPKKTNYNTLLASSTIATPTIVIPPVVATTTSTISSFPKVLIQPGYATGDMFGIAAALIDDPTLHVVISTGNGTVPDPTDKGPAIQQFYLDSGIPLERTHLIPINNIRGEGKTLLQAKAREIRPIGHGRIEAVNYGTQYVAKHFSDEMRVKIRNAWDVNDSKDDKIEEWLKEKKIPLRGKNILVLWSRFSGKKGDIHLEHDSSYSGIEQIAAEAALSYDAVIIAGDKGYTKEKAKKYDQIAAKINEGYPAKKVFNLTEFWNDKENPKLLAWGGDTRFGQFKLYDYLQRNFLEVKHLGFRSGNLEVMAMLGYQVRYMEEPDSEGGKRMTAWHRTASGRTATGGLPTGYERLLLTEPPTRSGKYLYYLRMGASEEVKNENRRPAWAPAYRSRKEDKPTKITESYTPGFNNINMDRIRSYLRSEVIA